MEYETFLKQIQREVEKQAREGTRVLVSRVLKNNRGALDGLTIMAEGEHTAPTVYMDAYYQQFLKGTEISSLAEQILAFHQKHKSELQIDTSGFEDFALAREHLVCRLIHAGRNEELLQQVPHQLFLDLAVVYYYRMDNGPYGKGNVLIQNAHLERWQVTEGLLHETAVQNTRRILPYECISLSDLLEETFGIGLDPELEEVVPMYVLTNTERYCGAFSMYFPDVLAQVAEKTGGDFYLMPSSVHECMVVPVINQSGMSAQEMQRMVCEINQEHVAQEEVLGDSVYRYFSEWKELRIVARPQKKTNKNDQPITD